MPLWWEVLEAPWMVCAALKGMIFCYSKEPLSYDVAHSHIMYCNIQHQSTSYTTWCHMKPVNNSSCHMVYTTNAKWFELYLGLFEKRMPLEVILLNHNCPCPNCHNLKASQCVVTPTYDILIIYIRLSHIKQTKTKSNPSISPTMLVWIRFRVPNFKPNKFPESNWNISSAG